MLTCVVLSMTELAHGKVFVEVGAGQAQIVKDMFEKNGFACYVKNDYNNIERIVVGELL